MEIDTSPVYWRWFCSHAMERLENYEDILSFVCKNEEGTHVVGTFFHYLCYRQEYVRRGYRVHIFWSPMDIREITFVTEWTIPVGEDIIYSTLNSHVLDKIIPAIWLSRSRTSRSAYLMNDEWMDVVSLVPPMSRNSQDKNIQRCRDRTRLTLERSRLLDWVSFHCHP